jgi:hypothetical protein
MDLAYFKLRWSDDWNNRTLAHVQRKWGLQLGDPNLLGAAKFLKRHQQLASERPLHTLLGVGHASWVNRKLLSPLQSQIDDRQSIN